MGDFIKLYLYYIITMKIRELINLVIRSTFHISVRSLLITLFVYYKYKFKLGSAKVPLAVVSVIKVVAKVVLVVATVEFVIVVDVVEERGANGVITIAFW